MKNAGRIQVPNVERQPQPGRERKGGEGVKRLVIVATLADEVAAAMEYGPGTLEAWAGEALGTALECDADSGTEWAEEAARRWGLTPGKARKAFRVRLARVEDAGETGVEAGGGFIVATVGGEAVKTLRKAARAMNAAGTCGKNTALSVFREGPWSWAEKFLDAGELAGDLLSAHDDDPELEEAFRAAGLLRGKEGAK